MADTANFFKSLVLLDVGKFVFYVICGKIKTTLCFVFFPIVADLKVMF